MINSRDVFRYHQRQSYNILIPRLLLKPCFQLDFQMLTRGQDRLNSGYTTTTCASLPHTTLTWVIVGNAAAAGPYYFIGWSVEKLESPDGFDADRKFVTIGMCFGRNQRYQIIAYCARHLFRFLRCKAYFVDFILTCKGTLCGNFWEGTKAIGSGCYRPYWPVPSVDY